jgi:hypothetical protein
MPALIVPVLGICFLAHCIIIGKNEELDEQIRELCAKLSSSTEGAVKVRVGNKLQHLSGEKSLLVDECRSFYYCSTILY